MTPEILMLGPTTMHHRRVEISKQPQLQEDLNRLDLGRVQVQEYRIMDKILNQLEGILTQMAPLRHNHHTDHLVTMVGVTIVTREVNHMGDQMEEVRMVVVGQVEDLVEILDQGLEDRFLHQETLVPDLMDHHILQEIPAVDPDHLLLIQVGM